MRFEPGDLIFTANPADVVPRLVIRIENDSDIAWFTRIDDDTGEIVLRWGDSHMYHKLAEND